MGIEKELAWAIAATHDNVWLLHDSAVHIAGQIGDTDGGDAANQHAGLLHGRVRIRKGAALHAQELAGLLIHIQLGRAEDDAYGIFCRLHVSRCDQNRVRGLVARDLR
jgi:hypothetical protein